MIRHRLNSTATTTTLPLSSRRHLSDGIAHHFLPHFTLREYALRVDIITVAFIRRQTLASVIVTGDSVGRQRLRVTRFVHGDVFRRRANV